METALLSEALQLALSLLLPVLGACLCIAFVTAFLQGAMQAGDPSLSFVPKLLAVMAVLWLSRGVLSDRLLQFTAHVLAVMGQLGR